MRSAGASATAKSAAELAADWPGPPLIATTATLLCGPPGCAVRRRAKSGTLPVTAPLRSSGVDTVVQANA